MGLIYQSEEHGQAASNYGHDDATQRCDLVKFKHESFMIENSIAPLLTILLLCLLNSAESCIDGSVDASDDIANEKVYGVYSYSFFSLPQHPFSTLPPFFLI